MKKNAFVIGYPAFLHFRRTNCPKYPKIRLYLNDKLMGEKATTIEQEYKTTFTVPWSPGVLKAVTVENDQEVESTTLQTSGEAAKIKLTADRNESNLEYDPRK